VPSKKYLHDIDLQGGKLINVGPTNATIDSGLGSGGSDPALENRVEKLENQSATILASFQDNFDNADYIDTLSSSNVTRVTGAETYIAINTQTVNSSASLQTDEQTNQTSNITYSAGAALNVSQRTGVYTTKALTVNATAQATVNSSFTRPTANTFGAETNYSVTGVHDTQFNFYTVADSTTRWFFYQTQVGWGNLYGYAVSVADNSVVHPLFQIGTNNTATSSMTPSVFRTMSANIDNDGNVWVAAWRYIGGTAAINNAICIYKINKTTRAVTVIEETQYNQTTNAAQNVINSLDTLLDADTNRIHVMYHVNLSSKHFLLIYNGTNNTLQTNREITFGSISALIWNSKLVMSTSAQKEVMILSAYNATSNAMRAQKYSVGTSPPYGTQTQASVLISAANTNGNFECVLSGNDFIILSSRVANNNLDFARLPVTFTTSANYTVAANHVLSVAMTQGITSSVIDSAHVLLAYTGSDTGSLARLYYTRVRLSDGSTASANGGVLQQRVIANDGVQNFIIANPVFTQNAGVISLFYEKETGNPADIVGGVRFGTFTADVKIEIRQSNTSNTGESAWVTIYDSSQSLDLRNQIQTIGTTKKDRVQLRFTLSSLNGINTQTSVSSFSVTVPGSNSTGTFVSTNIISDRPIAKATINADVTLGNGSNGIDGTVSWFVSNDGGVNYYATTLGSDYVFATIGHQLRVKGVINIPAGGGFSPRIQSYSVVSGNVAQQSDLVVLNINLLKTSLQLNTLLTAQRYSWTNMMVDTFQNGDGVQLGAGVTLSAGTITGTGIVTSATETADIDPINSVIVVAETDGTVTFEFSRDNGVTWQAVNVNTLATLSLGTVKNKLKLRATLTSGTLYGWAYLYA
jgi:acetyltransferase-like isoleucine patch superfamily enzyme